MEGGRRRRARPRPTRRSWRALFMKLREHVRQGRRHAARADRGADLALHQRQRADTRARCCARSTARRWPTCCAARSRRTRRRRRTVLVQGRRAAAGLRACCATTARTACGNWIYCGCWTQAGNLTARRDTADPTGLGVYPDWGYSWPANRRILYNRASRRPGRQALGPEAASTWPGTARPGPAAPTCPTCGPTPRPSRTSAPSS